MLHRAYDMRRQYSDVIMSGVAGEFPAQRASNAEKVSMWWRHHGAVSLYPQVSLVVSSMHSNEVTRLAGKVSLFDMA